MLATLEKNEDFESPRRQSSTAYRIIRDDIIAGAYQPGKKLKIQDLALDLKVSPSAVREALSQLVPEQLVVSQDQRGFQVAPLSIADLEDLTDLRCEIEATALRRSVEQGDIDWETRVISAEHRLRALTRPASGNSPGLVEWRGRHADFHAALVSGCGSPRLIALHAQLYEQSERYRVLSAAIETERDVDQEHRELVTLALARDAEKLAANMLLHIRHTTMLIVKGAKAMAFG